MAESMLISLISLTITATFLPSRLFRTWLSTVVFPAPRKPDKTVTGSLSLTWGCMVGWSALVSKEEML